MTMDMGDALIALVRWIIALFICYAVVACALMILKIILNGTVAGAVMILRTKVGMVAMAGGAIYVVYLALKGWVI